MRNKSVLLLAAGLIIIIILIGVIVVYGLIKINVNDQAAIPFGKIEANSSIKAYEDCVRKWHSVLCLDSAKQI